MQCSVVASAEGSLEVKLPTIWTDGKAEVGRVREEKSRRETRENQREDQRRERERGKKMQVHEKVDRSDSLRFANDVWHRRVEK